MSFNSIKNEPSNRPEIIMSLAHTKMVVEDSEFEGEYVPKYVFKTIEVKDDPRQKITSQDLALANLKRLGVDGQLKMCMLSQDNPDLVTSQIENMYQNEKSKVSAEDK